MSAGLEVRPFLFHILLEAIIASYRRVSKHELELYEKRSLATSTPGQHSPEGIDTGCVLEDMWPGQQTRKE